jgi:hypothetical protein
MAKPPNTIHGVVEPILNDTGGIQAPLVETIASPAHGPGERRCRCSSALMARGSSLSPDKAREKCAGIQPRCSPHLPVTTGSVTALALRAAR